MTDIEKARREFLDECDVVVRCPAVCFINGNHFSFSTTTFSIPLYIYMGFCKDFSNNNFEIKVFDESVNSYDIKPENMKSFNSKNFGSIDRIDKIVTMIKKDFLNFGFYKIIENMNKECPYSKKWTDQMFLCELAKHYRNLKKFKLKIWSEIPFRKLEWWEVLQMSFCTLIFSLGYNLTPSEFSKIKEKYKRDIIDKNESGVPLTQMDGGGAIKRRTVPLINKIFSSAFALSYHFIHPHVYTILVGNIIKEKSWLERYYGIHYTIDKPTGFEKDIDLTNFWQQHSENFPKERRYPTLEYLKYYVDIIHRNMMCVKLSKEFWSLNTDFLVFQWDDKERGLIGPILEPIFFDFMPHQFSIQWPFDEFSIGKSAIPKGLRYDYEILEIWGPSQEIKRIKSEFERNNYKGKILYDSTVMGWDKEGTKLLEPSEYRLTTIRRKHIAKSKMPQLKSELKFGIVTHKGLGDIKKIGLYEFNKSKYHIWVDERTGEIKHKCYPKKKPHLRKESFRALVYILRNYKLLIHWKTLYENVSESRDKAIRVESRAYKRDIQRWMYEIKNLNHGTFHDCFTTLETYQAYKLKDNITFCLVHLIEQQSNL